MSNCQIINYASGFRESCHVNIYFKAIQLSQKCNKLLDENKWYWANQGYQLAKCLMLSYKHLANNVKKNQIFNYYLSKI